MGKLINLVGQKFHSLTVIDRVGSRDKKALWFCICDCGNETQVISSNLTSGRIKSCGCARNTDMTGRKLGRLTIINRTKIIDGMSYWLSKCECGGEIELPWSHMRHRQSCDCISGEKHGLASHPAYHVWATMRQRCYSESHLGWKNYGGRGISVCKEWRESFVPFYKWAIDNGYEEHLSIDRIDVNGNYEPSNCRWATTLEQAQNKRNTVYVQAKGESKTISEWANEMGLRESTIRSRYYKGIVGDDLVAPMRRVKGGIKNEY